MKWEQRSGRTLRLHVLDQHAIYSGLLEGIPTDRLNERIVNYAIEQAREKWKLEPYLIEPVATPIKISRPYPFGEPMKLPRICCKAFFSSSGDDPVHSFDLPIIWFQEDFAFPIEPDIEEMITQLDWREHAHEVEL